MAQDSQTLHGDDISAVIVGQGAELVSLRDADGLELVWQAGPAWRRHSPVLFPIVGRLKGDQLRHRGQTYSMTQHGFARDKSFAWAERGSRSCMLVLTDDAETRTHYPFAFRLAVTYTLDGRQLGVTFEITNTGDEPLPASIGMRRSAVSRTGYCWRQGSRRPSRATFSLCRIGCLTRMP